MRVVRRFAGTQPTAPSGGQDNPDGPPPSYRRLSVEARYRALLHAPAPVDFRGRPYDAFDLRGFLEAVLSRISLPARPQAFEYGTGTGAGACFLAARGFDVDAIDTSPAAIELARQFSAELAVAVRFEVADIACLAPWPRQYDLVVDNFCMHNLIADADRRNALGAVCKLLRRDGHFVLGSSVFEEGRDYGDDVRDDRTGIVYSPLPDPAPLFEDSVLIDGLPFYARLRHVEVNELRAELESGGFVIIEQDRGRALCRRDPLAT